MKMPMNYEERIKLTDKFCGMNGESNLWTWEEIKDLKNKHLLENFDLFVIYEDDKEWHSILFINNKWYVVPEYEEMQEVSEYVLEKYVYLNKNFRDNPYQDFIKRRGDSEFNELSMMDKQKVYTGTYLQQELNETLDGLKGAFEDLIKILKEEKENKNE